MPRLSKINLTHIVTIFLVVLGIFFRFDGLNWDENQHLHPDERFLTMVANDMTLPNSWGEYFDQSKSSFNPANINYKFYVYGVLPVTLTKITAMKFGLDNYTDITQLGRFISAFLDSANIIIIFVLVRKLKNRSIVLNKKYIEWWSAGVYAMLVLPIQQSHFFTTDTFANTLILLSLFMALPKKENRSQLPITNILFSGLVFGLALACKINSLYSLPLIFSFLGWHIVLTVINKKKSVWTRIGRILGYGIISAIIFFLCSYITVRFTNPYYFQNPSWLNPEISQLFITNINQLKGFSDPKSLFPPGIQWHSKTPIIFPFQNIFFFGLGMPIAILMLTGLFKISKMGILKRDLFVISIILWSVGLFTYQGAQFVHSIRYFFPLYPFMAVFSAYAIHHITFKRKTPKKFMLLVVAGILVVWPLMFTHIYRQPHSRVEASRWIYKNIPAGSKILTEHWDDGLPLGGTYGTSNIYHLTQLEVFAPDSIGKINKLDSQLQSADYYIMSSNRAWGSMMADYQDFPMTSQFYKELFSNQYPNYELVKEFTSYPQLCLPIIDYCIEFEDQWADEAFTVYDHPKVSIFKNIK